MVELPEPQSHTVLAIWEAYEADGNGNRDSLGIPMSQVAHECERSIWYVLRWASDAEELTGQKIRRFRTGDREEERLLDDLERAGVIVERVDPATGQQFRVQMAEGWLRGRMDAVGTNIPEAPKTRHVIECKSHNEKSFNELWKRRLKDGKKDHYAQCQAYMHAEKITRCLYIAVNKNTDEIYCERVRYDKAYGEAMVTRANRLVRTDIAPPRLFEDIKSKGAYVCMWCRSKAQCHEGAFARRNCRTCISSEFLPGPVVRCTLHDRELDYDAQQAGCPSHLYLPSLVPGEQLDADEKERWVKYRLRDGTEWTNQTSQEAPNANSDSRS